jgi:hypothetical protein
LQQQLALKELSSELQVFISNLASGYTKMDDLLSMRDDILSETKRAEAAVKNHLSDKLQQLQIKDETKFQGERVLRSLKYPEMNQRLNNIKPADETTFTRVFHSYDALTNEIHSSSDLDRWTITAASPSNGDPSIISNDCSNDISPGLMEIDSIWSKFIGWIRSDGSLFWIQGKPGSGKSTLMKFLVEHAFTDKLLKIWRPETIILSHFFWKAGSDMQSSLKGLFCSLLHQALALIPDQKAMNFVIQSFSKTQLKDTVDDWSLTELQNVFFIVYREYAPSTCIFLDGLDEISQKDGASSLIKTIYNLKSLKSMKICTASRPEWLFRERLVGVPTLKLEDLTRPDMHAFVHKELSHFVEEGGISNDFKTTLVSDFVSKTHGVFLWLSLALRSVQSGLEKQDCERELALRLEGLPAELEDLYADMWKRLNHDEAVYRKRAAHYLNLVLSRNYAQDINLCGFVVMVAADSNMQDDLLNLEKKIDRSILCQLCKRAKREILTRCVGLLEFIPSVYIDPDPSRLDNLDFALHWDLQFTHRTVYDFLTETEPGQRILDYDEVKFASLHLNLGIIRGHLCLTRALSTWDLPDEFSKHFHQSGRQWDPRNPIRLFYKLQIYSMPHEKEDENAHATIQVLEDVKRFYDRRILSYDKRPDWYPAVPFLVLVAKLSNGMPILEEYVLAAVERDGPSLATDILRNVWFLIDWAWADPLPSSGFVQELLKLGAKTSSYDISLGEPIKKEPQTVFGGSPMARFLLYCCKMVVHIQALFVSGFSPGYTRLVPIVLETAVAMTDRHPDLSERVLCFCTDIAERSLLNEDQLHSCIDAKQTIAVLEVDLAFLLSYVLSRIASQEPRKSPRLHELFERSKYWFASVPYIIYKSERHGYSVFQPPDQIVTLHYVLTHVFQRNWTKCEAGPTLGKDTELADFVTDEGFLGEGYKWLFDELAKKQMGIISIDDLKAKRHGA